MKAGLGGDAGSGVPVRSRYACWAMDAHAKQWSRTVDVGRGRRWRAWVGGGCGVLARKRGAFEERGPRQGLGAALEK